MKRLMFTLVVVIAVTILGCQNTPTDPTVRSTAPGDGLSKAVHSLVRISLNGTPREPYPNSGLIFTINGFLDYSMVRTAGTGNLFSLHLETNARLTPRADDQGALTLAFFSNHVVSVSEEGVTFQEVRYVFPERGDRLALFITFQITQGSVEVADMLLDFNE